MIVSHGGYGQYRMGMTSLHQRGLPANDTQPLSCSCPFSYSNSSLSCFDAMPRAKPDDFLAGKLKDWLGKGLGGAKEWPWEPTRTQVSLNWSTDPFPFAEKEWSGVLR